MLLQKKISTFHCEGERKGILFPRSLNSLEDLIPQHLHWDRQEEKLATIITGLY